MNGNESSYQPISFKQVGWGLSPVYDDEFGDRVFLQKREGQIVSFRLEFGDHALEYDTGAYRYFETTDERGSGGYPAPPVVLFKSFLEPRIFLDVLEARSGEIDPVDFAFITRKVREAKANPGGL